MYTNTFSFSGMEFIINEVVIPLQITFIIYFLYHFNKAIEKDYYEFYYGTRARGESF